jgi:LacI family transcriptional regulator
LRMQGFCQRVQEAGFQASVYTADRPGLLQRDWQAGTTWLKGMESAIQWLRSLPRPVGLMAADDLMGYDITEVAEEIGIHVPEEVAIVGLNNDEVLCNAARPPLSSIEISLEKAGYKAAELLNEIITRKQKMAGQAILAEATRVVARQSSEILAVSDPQVAAALHFIRTHFHQPIQVVDVVNAACAGRRTLELRFRQLLSRSVLDEIMRMRIEHLANVLLSTDISIEQIAATSTFESAGYMSRLFKKYKGLSPNAYRRLHRST